MPQAHGLARALSYQVAGDGPIDLLMIAPAYSNIELFWTNPSFGPFLVALGSEIDGIGTLSNPIVQGKM